MPSELIRTEYEKYCQTLEDTVIAFWIQRDESHLKENIRQLWEVGVPSREIKSQVEQILVKSERSSVEAEFHIGPTRYRAPAGCHWRSRQCGVNAGKAGRPLPYKPPRLCARCLSFLAGGTGPTATEESESTFSYFKRVCIPPMSAGPHNVVSRTTSHSRPAKML